MAVIKFGTDGWRGIIARDFTFENVALCAQGLANYLKKGQLAHQGLVVGYDTRFASRDFAVQVAEVLAGNDIKVFLCDKAAPTPVVSYNIRAHHAAGAAIITASHNPYQWNGFKFKPHYGGSASASIVAQLEAQIALVSPHQVKSKSLSVAEAEGGVARIDPDPPYLQQLARLVDLSTIRAAGLRIVADAMHGAGAGYLPSLLGGHNSVVDEINAAPNPAFPGMEQPEPIATNLTGLSRLVGDRGADAGIAYDGDADRVGVIDEKGRYLNTLQVFALLALYLLEVRGERGPIVKSLTSSDMIFKLGNLFRVPVIETGVGFKYIGPLMMERDALMGGEESGGYGFRGHIPERDGILSSLFMLDFMVRTGKRPSELLQHLHDRVGEHFYRRRDVHFTPEDRPTLQQSLADSSQAQRIGGMRVTGGDTLDGRRFRFDHGWLILRFSGTEPLLRLYAEADSPQRVEAMLDGALALLGLASKAEATQCQC